ncbi:MAG: transcriptional regulator, LuxR family [Fluviicola sp.]|uniref:LuxR C-terminal-related transcriptional regulator n=1 Tax=Fluviicola sp. TaxID=1917219 RepID=UPI002614B32A|nr:LuxR C-terminal-related transcriptional regulator [Fluviicola sp.]MDF3028941.1 transcriptional regulator, LuxR family [Fluviicola sp.]
MNLYLDSRTQLISLGFKELVRSIFGEVSVKWHSGNPGKEQVNPEKKQVLVYNFSDNYQEIENNLKITPEDTNCIKVVLIISGDVSGLPKLVSYGVSGFIDINCTLDELKEAFQKMLHNQNYYCEVVWNRILNQDDEITSPTQFSLTKRETEIVESLLNGKSTAEISRELGLSPHTVQTHRKNCFRKLKVKSLSELLLFEMENQVFKK